MTTLTAPTLPLAGSRKALRAALWIVQGLLALAFIGAGVMKSTTPIADLASQMAWVTTMPAAMVRFIGISELAGGIGLILPALTRIKPILTPLAATGLAVIMVLALGLHVVRGETGALAPSFILGALAAFVAYGRFKLAPIAARS